MKVGGENLRGLKDFCLVNLLKWFFVKLVSFKGVEIFKWNFFFFEGRKY